MRWYHLIYRSGPNKNMALNIPADQQYFELVSVLWGTTCSSRHVQLWWPATMATPKDVSMSGAIASAISQFGGISSLKQGQRTVLRSFIDWKAVFALLLICFGSLDYALVLLIVLSYCALWCIDLISWGNFVIDVNRQMVRQIHCLVFLERAHPFQTVSQMTLRVRLMYHRVNFAHHGLMWILYGKVVNALTWASKIQKTLQSVNWLRNVKLHNSVYLQFANISHHKLLLWLYSWVILFRSFQILNTVPISFQNYHK